MAATCEFLWKIFAGVGLNSLIPQLLSPLFYFFRTRSRSLFGDFSKEKTVAGCSLTCERAMKIGDMGTLIKTLNKLRINYNTQVPITSPLCPHVPYASPLLPALQRRRKLVGIAIYSYFWRKNVDFPRFPHTKISTLPVAYMVYGLICETFGYESHTLFCGA